MRRYLAALALTAIAAPAFADDLESLRALSQAEFGLLAKDFAAAASYKSVSPAEPLGVVGFDIGLEASGTRMNNSSLWRKAGADSSTLYLPRLHVHKGLPFGIDVGASLTAAPDSDIKLIGAEIKYAIVSGSTVLPAVAIRAAATRLSGVEQVDLSSRSLELSVSKGFLNLTPYAGVGRVWGDVTPNVTGLRKESPKSNKVFAGVNVNLGLVNVAMELDRIAGNQTASVKLGFRL
jgi:hypothetical protein